MSARSRERAGRAAGRRRFAGEAAAGEARVFLGGMVRRTRHRRGLVPH